MQYLLTFPIMVLASTDNHQAAVTLPAGALIDVVGPVEADDRFLVVNAEDGQFHIFCVGSCGPGNPGGCSQGGAGLMGREPRIRTQRERNT